MNKSQTELLGLLKDNIVPATGCTEPIAIAYAVARAREQVKGNLVCMDIQVDSNIYKNGLMVTIPGTKERGLTAAAALGFVAGDSQKNFQVIGDLTDQNISEAKKLIEQGKIKVALNRHYQGLHIEVILTTHQEKVRVITSHTHLNIVHIEKVPPKKPFSQFQPKPTTASSSSPLIQNYELADFLSFSQQMPLSELLFLAEGTRMNLTIAQEGLTIEKGVGCKLNELVSEGIMNANSISRAQILCAGAAEARMVGSRLPVMSTAGSGNHGITVFLTNYAVAETKKLSREKHLRALALSHLMTFFIKSYTGTLSAMCGCGVAAGIGASAGVVWMLGGKQKDIMGALYNMVGSISGVICDGAKEGCAYKLALAAGWAVQSALLSLKGAVIHSTNGIIAPGFRQLFQNLGYLCDPGMIATDQAILDVMLGGKKN